MSADNWGICPRCKVVAEASRMAKELAATNAYGKVSADEWKRLDAEASSPILLDQTLREDFEVGMDEDGTFGVDYRASCRCGFSFAYEHNEKVGVATNETK